MYHVSYVKDPIRFYWLYLDTELNTHDSNEKGKVVKLVTICKTFTA